MSSTSLGSYQVQNKSLIRLEEHQKSSQYEFLQSLIEQDFGAIHRAVKKESHEAASSSTQTKISNDGNEKCAILNSVQNIYPRQSATNSVFEKLAANEKFKSILDGQTEQSSTSVITTVREVLIRLISNAKNVSEKSGRKRLIVADLELALVLMKCDSTNFSSNHMRTSMSERTFWGRKPLAKPDSVISKEVTLKVTSNAKYYNIINIKDYWLCIDGVQPSLPENVQLDAKNSAQQDEKKLLLGLPDNVKPLDKNVEKRLTKQTLPIEQQVFFNEIVNVVTNGTVSERRKMLSSLETDRGIQFLVGRLIVVFAEGIRINIASRNLEAVFRLVKLAGALIQNPYVKLDKHLQNLTPALVSCILTKTIVEPAATSLEVKGDVETEIQDLKKLNSEYSLRESTAFILVTLCRKFDQNRMLIRVSLTIRDAFVHHPELTTIYGAIYTLFAMGYLTLKRMLIPRLHDLYCTLFTSRRTKGVKNQETKLRRVINLIMRVLYEIEAVEGNVKNRTEADFVAKYAEFGLMLYRLLKEEGKLRSDGQLLVDPSTFWLTQDEKMLPYRNGNTIPIKRERDAAFQEPAKTQEEEMLDNLLDESVNPWPDVKQRLAAKKNEPSKKSTSLIDNPKLVVIKKSGDRVNYCRPLEPIILPKLEAHPLRGNLLTRSDSLITGPISRGVSTSRTRMSMMEEESVLPTDSGATLVNFLKKQPSSVSALVYGAEITSKGQKTIDRRISDAIGRLSIAKMRQAVVLQSSFYTVKTDTPVGRFLANSASLNSL